jgi:hypothetical protein
MHRVLSDILHGAYLLEPLTEEDLSRANEIDRKFRLAPLDRALELVVAPPRPKR